MAVLVAGCGGKKGDSKSVGAKAIKEQPVTAEVAAESGAALVSAITAPHEKLRALLPAHTVAITSDIAVAQAGAEGADKGDSDGGLLASEELSESWNLSHQKERQFHIIHTNGRDQGEETIWDGAQLYVRLRYGKFLKRPADDDERQRRLQETLSVAGETLRPVAFSLTPKLGQPRQVAGVAAQEIQLSCDLNKTAPAPSSSAPPEQLWRSTVKPLLCSGVVWVDVKNGLFLGGEFQISYAFARDNQQLQLSAKIKADVTGVATPWTAPDPASFVGIPRRKRPVQERNELLGKRIEHQ